MRTAEQLVSLSKTRLGEKYLNVLVPKNNANWHGPWDCAEFISWLVYQKTKKIYGCTDNNSAPELAEAYSGAWARDAKLGILLKSTEDEATNTAGIILIRRPPASGKMGHVAVSDGFGKTIEAAGIGLGVREDKVRGRLWDYAVKIPELIYSPTSNTAPQIPLPFLVRLETPTIKGSCVLQIQQALKSAGFDPGKVDGEFGPLTAAAVGAFQASKNLVADGVVGPLTAKKLALDWPR